MSSNLSATKVQAALETRWLARTYIHLDAVDSTNSALQKMCSDGNEQAPPEGTVVLAEYQSHGRGRMGRRWLAPAGSSLLLSTFFRPLWAAQQAPWLTMIAGLAAAEAIEAITPLTIGLKWPNDLVLSVAGIWRKVGGLLLEGNVDADAQLQSAVVGIGINVNISANELPETTGPVTSLMIEAGRTISRLDLLVALLGRLEALYEEADRGVSPGPAWKRRLITLGNGVTVTPVGHSSPLTGLAEDTDDWGRLIVRDAAGDLHRFSAGDVTLNDPPAGS